MITTCVLFNHPYPKNIPALRELLSPRFHDLVFSQPLVRGEDPDVITTYRGSYNFHGQVADIVGRLLERGAEFYIFMQDDVLLNPRLTDSTLVKRLGLRSGGSFIPDVAPLGGQLSWWPWTARTIWQTFHPMNPLAGSGVENLAGLLPDGAALRRRLEEHYGFEFKPLHYDREADFSGIHLFPDPGLRQAALRIVLEGLFASSPSCDVIELPFPYCRAMSDFFVVHRQVLPGFAEMLGWFAAADIFAEVAIPTALLACADHVVQSRDVGLQVDWRWGEDRTLISADEIIERFRGDMLLVHPVKISRDKALVQKVINAFELERGSS